MSAWTVIHGFQSGGATSFSFYVATGFHVFAAAMLQDIAEKHGAVKLVRAIALVLLVVLIQRA